MWRGSVTRNGAKASRRKTEIGGVSCYNAALNPATSCETAMPSSQAAPQDILYSLPTISNDLPPLEAPIDEPSGADMFIEEDMWSQIEFFARDRQDGIRHMLAEYSGFERRNREGAGWRQIYVRKLARAPVIAGTSAVADLEKVLGLQAGRAPLIYSSQKVSGKIKNGFCFKLDGNVSLYGHADELGITTLGAALGYMADSTKLTDAFAKLHAAFGVMLVDWCAQVALVAVNANGQIDVLRP
jgi:hypothetical protein